MANVRSTQELLKSFEDFMKGLDWSKPPHSLYVPVEYILTLGGKRIRPISLLHISQILDGNTEASMHAACGLELFHNFSLIHDDIMDQSELRRSKATVHKKYGLNAAILSGDVMMIESMYYISQAEKRSGKTGLMDLFVQTAREVCEGQAMDMDFEDRSELNYAEYLEMIRLKTAVLLAFGFKAAAIVSDQMDSADLLYDLGIYTGLAFQLEDDWLDFYAEEPAFGKIKGGDILNAKKSGLILELMEELNDYEKSEFINWYQQERDDTIRISKMTGYFNQYAIQEKFKQRIFTFQKKAFDCIDQSKLNDDQKKKLIEFITGIFGRKI